MGLIEIARRGAAALEAKAAFREWLASLPPDEPVGLLADGLACPIALFLREKVEGFDDRLYVTSTDIRAHREPFLGPHMVGLAPWVARFTTEHDRAEQHLPRWGPTAAECLAILS